MSADLEYELMKYDAYSSYAQIFLRRGMAKEAQLFESLADLCYDKAQLIGKVDQMVDEWVRKMPTIQDSDSKPRD